MQGFDAFRNCFSICGMVRRTSYPTPGSRVRPVAVILNPIVERHERQSRDYFKAHPLEPWLIMRVVTKIPALSPELP